jgi:hypothetical protein
MSPSCFRILILSFVCVLFHSCMGQSQKISCKEYFLKARKIINTNNYQKLDSALFFINQSVKCDTNKIASVELKIYILYALGKYQEGIRFIDSLSTDDFSYEYKKQILSNNLLSMTIDSSSQRILLKRMDSSLTAYINSRNLSDIEEEQAFIDLFAIKKRYMGPHSIAVEIDSLIVSRPQKQKLFEMLRNTAD